MASGLVRVEGFLSLLRDEDVQNARAGLPLALPGLQSVSLLRWGAPAARSAVLEMARPHAPPTLPTARRRTVDSRRRRIRTFAPVRNPRHPFRRPRPRFHRHASPL